jgi:hypothetical protein
MIFHYLGVMKQLYSLILCNEPKVILLLKIQFTLVSAEAFTFMKAIQPLKIKVFTYHPVVVLGMACSRTSVNGLFLCYGGD